MSEARQLQQHTWLPNIGHRMLRKCKKYVPCTRHLINQSYVTPLEKPNLAGSYEPNIVQISPVVPKLLSFKLEQLS